MTSRRFRHALFWFSLLGVISPTWAATPPASLTTVLPLCADCHGPDGVSNDPQIPRIAGLSAKTLRQALATVHSGKRSTGGRWRPLPNYSALPLDELAAYFAARAFVPAPQNADPLRAQRGAVYQRDYCEKCHIEGGRTDPGGVSLLAGQWLPYLQKAMNDFRTGQREMPLKMAKRLSALEAEQGADSVEDLLQFYIYQP